MRLIVLSGILLFVCGLAVGSMVGNKRSAHDLATQHLDITVQAGLKLAFSSYLRACTEALDAAHNPGDQYQSCFHLAQNYMKNNVHSILGDNP